MPGRIRPAPIDPKLVWVVDDDSWLGDLLQMALRPAGYRTRWFGERAEAWEALRAADLLPGLITTDFVGHKIEAARFMQLCRSQDPRIKILLITGCDETCLNGCSAMPDGFLEKPFGLDALLAEVDGLSGMIRF